MMRYNIMLISTHKIEIYFCSMVYIVIIVYNNTDIGDLSTWGSR